MLYYTKPIEYISLGIDKSRSYKIRQTLVINEEQI